MKDRLPAGAIALDEDADRGRSCLWMWFSRCRRDDQIFRKWATSIVTTTINIVPTIQTMKFHLLSRTSNCVRLCAGSATAPNVAIKAAPAQVRIVPISEYRVKGSLSRRVAKAVLKTSPEACSVDRTGSGRVVIWIVLPMRFEATNMSIPICHFRLLYAGRRVSTSSLASSMRWDLRWSVSPRLCIEVERRPTIIPI